MRVPADKAYRLPNPPDQPTEAAADVAGGTVAAAVTPAGRGAIAVVEVRGPAAHRCVSDCFAGATPRPSHTFPVDAIRYGQWLGPAAGRAARSGESVVVVATAADAVEVHCHGGRAAVAQVLRDLDATGARSLAPEDFLLHTSQSPEHAELARILAHTSTTRTAAIALDQARGAMRKFAAELRQELTAGDLQGAQQRIAETLSHGLLGAHLNEPWRLVLAGPPNVGKSSLLNALLGYRRAITFAAPGTTRDVVSADAAIDGWPVRLSDTAGQRMTADPLESEGVRRAQTALLTADLVLLVIDAQEGLTETHRDIAARTSAPQLVVWNKSDLARPTASAVHASPGRPGTEFAVSATHGSGLAALEAGISSTLVPRPPQSGAAVPVTAVQRASLEHARQAATAAECLEALEPLGN